MALHFQELLARQGRRLGQVVRRAGDELPVILPTLNRGVHLHIRDAVDGNEALCSHHVQARNVSPIEPVMPLAWLIVETNDRELPRGSLSLDPLTSGDFLQSHVDDERFSLLVSVMGENPVVPLALK